MNPSANQSIALRYLELPNAGPMYFADTVGLQTLLDTVIRFADQHDEQYWQSPVLLQKLVADQQRFTDHARVQQ